jgi:hypothetical protein
VRIDHTHRKWFAASLVIFGVATAVYVPYAAHSPAGPRGGSTIGLAFGIIGSAFMVFAGLLSARKKVPVWRLGRAQSWMRGHLWLGLLSLPLTFYHAGFRLGGPLTSVLLWLLIIVVASGVFGAVIQHYLPRVMTLQVPGETIFEQIDHVREQLVAEADRLVSGAETAEGTPPDEGGGGLSLAMQSEVAVDEAAALRNFYAREMRAFLTSGGKRHRVLSDADTARSAFEGLRTLLPAELHEMTQRLGAICEEERQLRRESRIHHWLHGWLMVHIPLSFALLLLGCVHAITALRY